MYIAWLIGSLIGGGLLGYLAKSLRDRPAEPKPLPPGGGQPHDRSEAVRRVLKHLQRKTIAELVEGSAAVIDGTVRAVPSVQPLVAPFSGQPCIGYHLDVRSGWIDYIRFDGLLDEARCTDFELEDATGIIRVASAGLELAVTHGPFGYHAVCPPQLVSRLRGPIAPITVEEGLVVPGDRILVCGVVASELAATDYRDGKPVYTLRATPSFPLVASTDRDLFEAGDRPIAPEELHRRRT